MAGQTYTVPVADPKLALRKTAPSTDEAESTLDDAEQEEREEVNEIIEARKRYEQDRKGKEREWTESFKMYMSWVDKTINPFLSNLFIPKTHEAVELLAAFLIGVNQNVSASAENGETDTMKARVAGKWLDYLWRKVLRARVKILVWIKQGLIFGNGYIKVGWDDDKKQPWMAACAIEDVYVDYFEPDVQCGEYLIHEIRRDPDEVKNDTKYDAVDKDGKPIREQAILGGESFENTPQALFNTFDGSLSRSENRGKVLVMEVWCDGDKDDNGDQKLITLLPTSMGWRIARKVSNPNKWKKNNGQDEQFRPFAKLRLKVSALPNRAYDTGAVWPTVHIQKAFNDLIRQYFDSVQLINSPMWKKRRGARINPSELVRRPGGVITMGDITKDLATDTVSDVKQSMIEMLNRLDGEFQEASMVVNLLKGMSQSQTATGDTLSQQNVQTLLDMVNQNVEDALSELGEMVLAISLQNTDGVQSLVLWENPQEIATFDFDPKNIDGMHDIRIVPDRTDATTKAAQNKALVDFLKLVSADRITLMQYPSLREKLYKRFLDNSGVGDPDYFFTEDQGPGSPPNPANRPGMGIIPSERMSVNMNYKDLPPDIQREVEQMMGFPPSQEGTTTRTGKEAAAAGAPVGPAPAGGAAPPAAAPASPLPMPMPPARRR